MLSKIAITGGVACGKSTVTRFFQEMGAYVTDADKIVHQLLDPNTELGKKVIELLGPEIVANNQIDRQRIARKVFNHPKLLRSLEELLHPKVYESIKQQFETVSKDGQHELFIAEVPLLFESEGELLFDKTVAVISDHDKSWERYRDATGYEREEYSRRMSRQLSADEKAKRADYVIENNGDLEELKKKVTDLYQTLTTN